MRRTDVWVLAALLFFASATAVEAGPPAATLLPANTKLFISIPRPADFDKAWGRTQISKLFADPKLKPFIDELDQQGGMWMGTGLLWEDVRNAAGGEIAWATLQPAKGQVASIVLIDIDGKGAGAQAALKKAVAGLEKQGYAGGAKKVGAISLSAYGRAADQNHKAGSVFLGIQGDLLGISDDESLLQNMLERGGPAKDNLAETKPYKEVIARCQAQTKVPPHAVWFIEPIGLAEAERAQATTKRRGTDYLKILKEQGFSAFQGIGGFVHLDEGTYDMLHHTAFYCPPPHEKALRAIRVAVPGELGAPLPWTPPGLGMYGTLQVDIDTGFRFIGPLFDAVLADGEVGAFDEVIKDLRDDVNGPQVDVAKEIIGRLGKKVHYLGSTELPIGPHSSSTLLAVETSDAKGLAAALKRLIQDDPEIKQRKVSDEVLLFWELSPRQKKSKGKPAQAKPARGVAVARDHLLLTDDVSFLDKVLQGPAKAIADDPDYRRVTTELDKFSAAKHWMRFYGRPDIDLHAAFEMARRKELDKSDSLYAQALKVLWGEGLKQVDPGKLPEFTELQRYLGPTGMLATNQDDGWFFIGFSLKKTAP